MKKQVAAGNVKYDFFEFNKTDTDRDVYLYCVYIDRFYIYMKFLQGHTSC